MPHTETKSLWLGFFAVTLFALTLPMTKLAMGANAMTGAHFVNGLSPWFIAFGRAAVAGILSAAYLYTHKAAWPKGKQWLTLMAMSAGNVFGFPIFQGLGLLYVSSAHAAVFNGLLPLLTAVMSAFLFRQKPSRAFWLCAVLGGMMVIAFSLVRTGSLSLHWGDILIFIAVFFCAAGYAFGAKLSLEMPAPQALCWMLVLSLPMTLPASALTFPSESVSTTAWLGFFYLSSVSMWFGMMVWYYALNLGGAVRVSQVQLLQVFLSILFAVPLLGEPLDGLTIGFALAVVAVAYVGKKMPTQTQPTKTSLKTGGL
ncbi:hypothetical protein DTO96_102286 [Ephemeroptericola cinctiostellae]|uniref:EamA domain-containing protein n=1 Tax=Ephemeroptericola cinctiostellae TaxID=2268024 RepID=A0A345DDU3_9BURK|nr:DMT family transporter [Ephemeroptericola cinctiostellae]AXF86531.1 hypothetical protein DTO96_102286 [Ephemeroptericola cinctiostellae]